MDQWSFLGGSNAHAFNHGICDAFGFESGSESGRGQGGVLGRRREQVHGMYLLGYARACLEMGYQTVNSGLNPGPWEGGETPTCLSLKVKLQNICQGFGCACFLSGPAFSGFPLSDGGPASSGLPLPSGAPPFSGFPGLSGVPA